MRDNLVAQLRAAADSCAAGGMRQVLFLRSVDAIERLQAENEALKTALGFYADPESWEPIQSDDNTQDWAAIDESDIDRSAGANVPIGGKRAREALRGGAT